MKKIKVLALVLVFAFASLGGAYAMLYDHLYIDETVNTSIVDVVWQEPDSSDPGPNYSGYDDEGFDGPINPAVYKGEPDRLDYGNNNDPKNVGSKDFELLDDTGRETLPGFVGTDTRMVNDLLKITLKNGYPGYQEYITATIKNVGKIPVKFQINPLASSTDTYVPTAGYTTGLPDWMLLKIVDASDESIVYFDSTTGTGSLEGKKLDPEQTITVKIIERILENAPQTAKADFTLQLRGIQWNEYGFVLPNEITTPAEGHTGP